jgi:hypothetical protein
MTSPLKEATEKNSLKNYEIILNMKRQNFGKRDFKYYRI